MFLCLYDLGVVSVQTEKVKATTPTTQLRKHKQQTQQQQFNLTVQVLYHPDLMPSQASCQFPWDPGYASQIWPASLQLASLHLK